MKSKLIVFLGGGALAAVFAQGPLTPPSGAPAPVMKTLAQIEPRVDVFSPPLNVVINTLPDYELVIQQPGSYYLTRNLTVTRTNGILCAASGITLDLNGFAIQRAQGSNSGGDAITIPAGSGHRSAIKNGSVEAGFAYGVRCGPGDPASRGGSFRQLAVAGCSATGLTGGAGWIIEDCTAHNNLTGILTRDGSTVSGCTSYGNSREGFSVSKSLMTRCTASENGGSGIDIIEDATVIDCVCSKNAAGGINATGMGSGRNVVKGCTCSENGGPGISMNNGYNTVSDCAVSGSPEGISIRAGRVTGCAVQKCDLGISATNHALVKDNHCVDMDRILSPCIWVHGSGSSIMNNHCVHGGYGIKVDGGGNLITGNVGQRSVFYAFWVDEGNRIGPVIPHPVSDSVPGVTGNSGAGTLNTTDPAANFAN